MKRHIIAGLLAFAALAAWQCASAQHTLGFTVGYGMPHIARISCWGWKRPLPMP